MNAVVMAPRKNPREFLLKVVEKAAKNTGSSIADVFRRTKSQNYLFGRLRKEFPLAAEDELRELITSARWEAADDPDAHKVFEKPRRPPSRGREPMESEKWDGRLRDLRAVMMDDPLTTDELLERARRELGWSANFFISVIAAAENRGVLVYLHPYWRTATKQVRYRSITARQIARAQIRAIRSTEKKNGEK